MGNLGLSEIMMVLVVALIVLGPTRLPGAARQMGKALQEFRRVTTDFQTEVRDAFTDPVVYPPPPSAAADTPPPGAPAPPVELPTSPEQAEWPRPDDERPA